MADAIRLHKFYCYTRMNTELSRRGAVPRCNKTRRNTSEVAIEKVRDRRTIVIDTARQSFFLNYKWNKSSSSSFICTELQWLQCEL